MRSSLFLGILGLIPFFVIAISCFIVPPEQDVYNLLIFIFLSYAAIISSFLGGIQWGLITAASDKLYHVITHGGYMQKYILLTSLTTLGRRTLKERPARMKEVDDEIRAMGIKIVGQFATLGPFDFINIVEAPNNEAISKLSIELTSRGTLQITTLPAIDIDSFIEKLNVDND